MVTYVLLHGFVPRGHFEISLGQSRWLRSTLGGMGFPPLQSLFLNVREVMGFSSATRHQLARDGFAIRNPLIIETRPISTAVVGIQHVDGGLFMAWGVLRADPTHWRHGLLCEAGYEVADLIAMYLTFPPYDSRFKEQLRVPTICHHIPGTALQSSDARTGRNKTEGTVASYYPRLGALARERLGCSRERIFPTQHRKPLEIKRKFDENEQPNDIEWNHVLPHAPSQKKPMVEAGPTHQSLNAPR